MKVMLTKNWKKLSTNTNLIINYSYLSKVLSQCKTPSSAKTVKWPKTLELNVDTPK